MVERTLGRKTMRPKDKLSEPLTIVVTKATKKALERAAAEAGYRSLAAYLREERLGIKG